ncbi:MAG: hypothetical protein R3F20_16645 [Planctomycetota bacterium]
MATLTESLARREAEAAELRRGLETVRREEAERLETLRATDDESRRRALDDLSRRREFRRALREEESRLRDLGGGLPLATLEAEAEGVDPDGLTGEHEAVRAAVESAQSEQRRLLDERGRLRNRQESMDGGDAAARAESERAALAARIVEEARRFRVLATSAQILRREIEAYRERNQGPVLARTGELLAIMTGSAFAGVEAELNERNETVLLARRADGSTAHTPELSDGTRDQLFLALRLATIEHLVASGERGALPLVLDDVLVHFDDERSRAALTALADLGRHVQVLLFTHHRRIAEMAEELGSTRAVVHDLGAAQGSGTAEA